VVDAVLLPADEEQPEAPGRRDRRPLAVFVVTTVATLVVLLVRNSQVLGHRMVADGDYAANELLMDKAKHFTLLIGNYSRVGFHHPGPALIDVQAFSDLFFHDWIPIFRGSFNAELFGVFVLNAVLLGACLRLLWEHGHRTASLVAAWAAIVLLLSTEPLSGLLASAWMPAVYTGPFLLFLVSSASVLAGRTRSLWIVVVSGGLLVHGHVSFVSFVVVIGLVLAGWMWWHERRIPGWWAANKRTFVLSGAIVALFLLPIVAELVLHWPGYFGDYLSYVGDSQYANKASFPDIVTFTLSYWWDGRAREAAAITLAVVAVAVVTTLALPRDGRRRFSWALLLMAAISTVLYLNYAINGVDDLNYRYVGYFYFAVKAIVAVVVIINVAALLRRSRVRLTAFVVPVSAVVLVAAAVTTPELHWSYGGNPRIPGLVQVLRDDPSRAGRTIAVRYSVDVWDAGLGVVEYAKRHGLPACVVGLRWEFMVLDQNICPDPVQPRMWLVDVVRAGEATPGTTVIYRDDQVTVAPAPG
jgi:hypothetical protein